MRTNARPHRPPPPQMPSAFRSNKIQPSTSINPNYLLPLSQQQYPNNQSQSNQVQVSTASPFSSTSAANTFIDDDDEEGEGWTCNRCTFQNYQLLRKCEQCNMPLVSAGNNIDFPGLMPMPPYLPPATQSPYEQYPQYIPHQQHPQPNQFMPFQQPT